MLCQLPIFPSPTHLCLPHPHPQVMQVSVECRTVEEGTGVVTRRSRLSLVDLAGSERQKAAETEGDRLKEAQVGGWPVEVAGQAACAGSQIMALLTRGQRDSDGLAANNRCNRCFILNTQAINKSLFTLGQVRKGMCCLG